MPLMIHNRQYVTVAERVKAAHDELKFLSITTELLSNGGPVVIKATVTTPKGTFTGISAANPAKPIEKMSPFEVAETSAVGRALGFAGYGIVEGIATADEMAKTDLDEEVGLVFGKASPEVPDVTPTSLGNCKKCGAPMTVAKSTGNVVCSDHCWLKDHE